MATLEFGESPTLKTTGDYLKEVQELLGAKPPLSVVVIEGNLKQVVVETEWKEGGTVPIEGDVEVEKVVVNDKGEEETVTETVTQIVDYVEDYTEKKLTQTQISKLNTYIADNIE